MKCMEEHNPCEGCQHYQQVEIEREATGPSVCMMCVDPVQCPLDAKPTQPEFAEQEV